MRGFLALLRLELLTEFRDRGRWTALIFVIGWFFVPGTLHSGIDWVRQQLPESSGIEREATVSELHGPCDADDAPPVALEGEWPGRLTWPEPFDDSAPVTITVTSRTDKVPLLQIVGTGAAAGQARRCLNRAVAHARRDRMAELGIQQDPERLTATTFRSNDTEPPMALLERLSAPALLLALLAFGLMGTLALEAVPRRRASGLLEQLRSTPTSAGWMVGAWLVSISMFVGGLVVACGASLALGAAVQGVPAPFGTVVHVGPLVLLTGAASIRSSLPAEDLLAASLRWSVVLVLTMVAVGIAVTAFAYDTAPAALALIPMGGSWLATAGVLGHWAWLADAMAVAYAAGLVAWSAWLLDHETASSSGASPVLMRQARGNYLPEALLLSAFGMAAAVLTDPGVFGMSLAPSIVLVFGVMMVTPAVVSGPLLGLPVRVLVPLAPPRGQDVGWLIPVAVGLLGLAPMVLALTHMWVPDSPLTKVLSEQLTDALQDPWVQVAVVLGPAVAEEFLFRGAIQGLLLRSGRPWLAIVAQAALFAVAHALAVRLPWTFVVGLVLGVIRWRTGSLWLCMLLHAAINGTAVLAAPGASAGAAPSVAEAVWWLPLAVGLGGVFWMRPRT